VLLARICPQAPQRCSYGCCMLLVRALPRMTLEALPAVAVEEADVWVWILLTLL